MDSSSQQRLIVAVCCGGLGDQMVAPFVFEGRLTGKLYLRFLQKILPERLVEMLLNK